MSLDTQIGNGNFVYLDLLGMKNSDPYFTLFENFADS